MVQLQGARSLVAQGADFAPARLRAAHPLKPFPTKRAKGFEPSIFSLDNASPELLPCEKVPCAAIGGKDPKCVWFVPVDLVRRVQVLTTDLSLSDFRVIEQTVMQIPS